jgi:hypothetical protein
VHKLSDNIPVKGVTNVDLMSLYIIYPLCVAQIVLESKIYPTKDAFLALLFDRLDLILWTFNYLKGLIDIFLFFTFSRRMHILRLKASPTVPIQDRHSYFSDKNRKNILQQFSILGCHLSQVRKKSLRACIYAHSYPRRLLEYQKRWKGINIILFPSQGS